MSTWVDGASGSTYDLDNLPYAVFSHDDEPARVGVRIGDYALDLAAVAAGAAPWTSSGGEPGMLAAIFAEPSLDEVLRLGRAGWTDIREWLTTLLSTDTDRALVEGCLIPVEMIDLQLPFTVADYVDFYCSENHATNVGRMFRPDGEALLPNWKHLPVGYHGRAGTVVVSGTPVRRPRGQRKPPHEDSPIYGPTRRLDIEAELGFVVGTPSELGEQVRTGGFAEHVFGVMPLNDWSARDIQAWEYAPLGPFLGKSFATSIAGWVTPLHALEAARVPLPMQEPPPLDYLLTEEPAGYDIEFEVVLNGEVVSRPPYASMYWSPSQMLAHLTVNGASLRTGDLFASGTISGSEPEQRGSLLELSWGGKEPFGDNQTFLEDGDEVTLRATAPGMLGGRIALGEVTGRIEPAGLD